MNCADRSVAETLKQSVSAGNNHYSAEQQTMPTRMEKKIYQQNNEKFLARAIPGKRGRNARFCETPIQRYCTVTFNIIQS